MKYQVFGNTDPNESEREKRNRVLAYEAACEGIVLLKNEDGLLPLKTKKIALYGSGSRMSVKGGSGSGDVHERHSVTVEEGLKNAGFEFVNTLWMDRFEGKYRSDVDEWKRNVDEKIKGFRIHETMKMFDVIHENPMPYPSCTPVKEDELSDDTDTAVYVLSRQAGEGSDRRLKKGDYYFSDIETESLKLLSSHYEHLILILNCGGVIDLSILNETRIDAVLFMGQAGMEGGNAAADILCGKVCPSGRLTDTWAKKYQDYPGADTFGSVNGKPEEDTYAEGIYVGYRWFEKKKIEPLFPFAYGLSFTAFRTETVSLDEHGITLRVTNTGNTAGKHAVPVFIHKPEGKYDCEERSLAAFAKTKLLKPGESEILAVSYDPENISVYDIDTKEYVIEKGIYTVDCDEQECGCFEIKETMHVRPHRDHPLPVSRKAKQKAANLNVKDLVKLISGGGYTIHSYNNVLGAAGTTATDLLSRGIPNIVLADGPAGININSTVYITKSGIPLFPEGLPADWNWGWIRKMEKILTVKPKGGKMVYRYMTAWPCETILACSWNRDLLYEVGKAIGGEMKETGISVWLAPGMNIHRSPLCGRNFEYYSEDPLLSGKMAAAITKGVQSLGGIGTVIKHFCCNNQEDERTKVNVHVDERTLREIYLRGFQIVVQESHPWALMTSYNRVNNEYTAASKKLCTDILRNEFCFDGVIMTDWNASDQCSHPAAVSAGNNLIMPGNKSVRKALIEAVKNSTLTIETIRTAAEPVLEMIYRSEVNHDFREED